MKILVIKVNQKEIFTANEVQREDAGGRPLRDISTVATGVPNEIAEEVPPLLCEKPSVQLLGAAVNVEAHGVQLKAAHCLKFYIHLKIALNVSSIQLCYTTKK